MLVHFQVSGTTENCETQKEQNNPVLNDSNCEGDKAARHGTLESFV